MSYVKSDNIDKITSDVVIKVLFCFVTKNEFLYVEDPKATKEIKIIVKGGQDVGEEVYK